MILGEPTRAIHAFALILASIAIAACTEQPSPPDVPYVSSDAYFEIAGHPFVLPVVAIPNMSRDSIEGHARNSDKPFRVDRLQLQILRYGTYGEFLASREICPRLTRRWSQDLCRGEQKCKSRSNTTSQKRLICSAAPD